jgi:hypothetical protein
MTNCKETRAFITIVSGKVRPIIVTLNLFENVDKPLPPEAELYAQRRWTHVYLVILALLISIIGLFTLFTYQTNTITINKPTLRI